MRASRTLPEGLPRSQANEISQDDAIAYGITGPFLRGTGVDYDVRKDCPYAVYDRLTYHAAFGSAVTVLSQSASLPTSGWGHKLRSILSFIGGCGLASGLIPAVAGSRCRMWRPIG